MKTATQPMSQDIFHQEFLQFEAQLKSYLLRLTANRQDTEDLFQETYLKALMKRSDFQGKSTLKTWVFAIATNLARDYFRMRQRWPDDIQDRCRERTQSDPGKVAAMQQLVAQSPAEQYEFREHIDYCFTCVAKALEIEQQLVLILKDIYRFTVSEIMMILKLSEGRVKYLLSESRRLMIDIFDKRCVLVSKKGVCYQCSEINGFINPKQDERRQQLAIKMIREAENGASKEHLFDLRTALVQQIDPLNAPGTDLHLYLLELMPESLPD